MPANNSEEKSTITAGDALISRKKVGAGKMVRFAPPQYCTILVRF
jgi:hypothetical protein